MIVVEMSIRLTPMRFVGNNWGDALPTNLVLAFLIVTI